MTDSTSSLPLILAGPILRRLETERVVFWMAATQDITVRIKFGRTVCHPTHRKLEIGENLHVLFLDGVPRNPFPTDEWVPYKLEISCSGRDWQDVTVLSPDLLYPTQKTLGFKIPSRVHSLLHGSCRKPHFESGDGLVEADNFLADILEGNGKQTEWPSFLVLGGDQIYADDVSAVTLRAIHDVIDRLSLPDEQLCGLEVPAYQTASALYEDRQCYNGRTEILPEKKGNRALFDMLFEGVRKPVFTTNTADNHLITLHEHLIMYLLVWSPEPWTLSDWEMPAGLSDEKKNLFVQEKLVMQDFVAGLPKVRRLFAHIPVAMIFDDHDITDDWNLNCQWEEAVYNHPFSTRMVGNGLMAYLVCQGWGNNPDAFDDALMDKLDAAIKDPGSEAHNDIVKSLLTFQNWEYDWPTSPPLMVMDTRTRRWRSESSKVKPSGLLDWEALIELQQRLFGKESVILVAPAPIFGVKLIEIIQRIFTWFGKPLVVDAENWMAHPGTANSILNIFMHSKTPQNVTILSGDVHYSFVYDVELKKQLNGPDIWQVTSSGLKNEFPRSLLDKLDVINRWLFSPRSPLNWLTRRRRMRVVPRKPDGHEDGRRLLNASGVGLVEMDEKGRPWRFRQLTCDHEKVEFHRMEHYSRWD